MHSETSTLGVKTLIKKFFKKLGSGVIFGIGATLGIGIITLVYATWTNLPAQTAGNPLTATIWNDLVNKINDIGGRTDGINRVGGNVGIGIVSPEARLHVNRNTGDTGTILKIGTGSPGQIGFADIMTNHGNIGFQVWDDNDLVTPKFIVQRSGNVGIGTATPAWKLDVNGAIGIHSIATNTKIGRIQMEDNLVKIVSPTGKQWDFRDDGTIWFYDGIVGSVWTKKSL